MPFGPVERRQLRQLLRQFRAAHGVASTPSGTGKALEAWVLMRMADCAHRRGWIVQLQGGDGLPLPAGALFAFRSQPGKIKQADVHAVGCVALSPPDPNGDQFELHGGVQWRGRSGARHECDVSMLPAVVGRAIRATSGGGYPRGLPVVAIECKDKGGDSAPDEMRQTLARLFDLACIQQIMEGFPHRIFTEDEATGWGWRSTQYRPFFSNGQFGIVRASGFGLGASQLGIHYKIARYSDIYERRHARSMRALLDRFTQILDALA